MKNHGFDKIFAAILFSLFPKFFKIKKPTPIEKVKTYDEKVQYFEKEVRHFKYGLPVFFIFNFVILIIVPIFIFSSIYLAFKNIEYVNKSIFGFNIIIEILIAVFFIFYITASESFSKFKKLIKFFRNKNDFKLEPLETNLALRILENSPIKLKEVLADPTLPLDKTKKLINLLDFCDFIKFKDGYIYQSGLHLID